MSGNPILGVTRDVDKRLKIIETERSPIAPRAGLILEGAWPRKDSRYLFFSSHYSGVPVISAAKFVRLLTHR
jgi:hypothetical protein